VSRNLDYIHTFYGATFPVVWGLTPVVSGEMAKRLKGLINIVQTDTGSAAHIKPNLQWAHSVLSHLIEKCEYVYQGTQNVHFLQNLDLYFFFVITTLSLHYA